MVRPTKLKRQRLSGSPSWEAPVAYDFVLSLTPTEYDRLLIALSSCKTLRLARSGPARPLRRRPCSSSHRHQWCMICKHAGHMYADTKFG